MIDPQTYKEIKESPVENDHQITQPVFFDQIVGMWPTVTTRSTTPPRNISSQVEIYINGATKLLRIYDVANNIWRELTIN